MTTTINHLDYDRRENATTQENGLLPFDPDETPEQARAWLARKRFERDQFARGKKISTTDYGTKG